MDPDQADLSQLPNPSEDNLTSILANRFQRGQFYTRIASSVLIQLNPYTQGKIDLPENVLQEQVLTYKDGARLGIASGNGVSAPHVIQMATSAYLHMRRTGQDQAIITRLEKKKKKKGCLVSSALFGISLCFLISSPLNSPHIKTIVAKAEAERQKLPAK